MTNENKRLLGGAAGIALVAALGGYGMAQWKSEPAAPIGAEAPKRDAAAEALPDSVAMTEDAVRQAGIATETIKRGG
ncbi:hypothetical protein, partial [Escherichia coli]